MTQEIPMQTKQQKRKENGKYKENQLSFNKIGCQSLSFLVCEVICLIVR